MIRWWRNGAVKIADDAFAMRCCWHFVSVTICYFDNGFLLLLCVVLIIGIVGFRVVVIELTEALLVICTFVNVLRMWCDVLRSNVNMFEARSCAWTWSVLPVLMIGWRILYVISGLRNIMFVVIISWSGDGLLCILCIVLSLYSCWLLSGRVEHIGTLIRHCEVR